MDKTSNQHEVDQVGRMVANMDKRIQLNLSSIETHNATLDLIVTRLLRVERKLIELGISLDEPESEADNG